MVVVVNMVRISYLLGTVYHTGGDITASTEMTYDEFVRDIHGIILTEQGNCPVSSLLQMLQGKWKFQILYEICIKDPIRYGELKRVIPGITSTMLSASLKDLERDGLVTRRHYEEIPPRVEYSLTQKGTDLMPVFYEMARWGLRYVP